MFLYDHCGTNIMVSGFKYPSYYPCMIHNSMNPMTDCNVRPQNSSIVKYPSVSCLQISVFTSYRLCENTNIEITVSIKLLGIVTIINQLAFTWYKNVSINNKKVLKQLNANTASKLHLNNQRKCL